MKLLRIFNVTLVALALAGCASSGQGWMGSPLKDTSWQLVTIESKAGDAGRQFVGNSTDVVMSLLASGDANFKLGCETGTTDWHAAYERIETMGEIKFDEVDIAATPTPCEPNVMAQRFLRDVEFLDGYVLIQNHLYLSTPANQTIYGWRKVERQ